MTTPGPFALRSQRLGYLPIVNSFLARMGRLMPGARGDRSDQRVGVFGQPGPEIGVVRVGRGGEGSGVFTDPPDVFVLSDILFLHH